MADEPENLMLIYLRRLDTKMDRVIDDMREVKIRVTTLEQQMAGLTASIAGNYASISTRLDRLENRVERIENRLELTEH